MLLLFASSARVFTSGYKACHNALSKCWLIAHNPGIREIMNIKIRPLRMVSSQSLCEQGRFFNSTIRASSSSTTGRNPFGAGTVFQSLAEARAILDQGRNPFGAGAVFQFFFPNNVTFTVVSQSLWSRDGFSIAKKMTQQTEWEVAIPLEQGRFFNVSILTTSSRSMGRNPFGAGTVFQSIHGQVPISSRVAIPLEQGRFFNKDVNLNIRMSPGRNPFGAGTVFQ